MMAADQTAQDTLRLQFKAMQEMQQRRLQKQMEKRKEKELNLVVVEDQNKPPEMSDGFSVLHAREQHSLSSFQQRVFEDEIQQLRDQLRETVDENGRLYKLLKERDFEIKHLKKKIEEDRFAFTGTAGVAGDVIATKIVELSKKNRMLMAESESAKSKVKQLNNRIQELERELQMAPARLPVKGTSNTGGKLPKGSTGERILETVTEASDDPINSYLQEDTFGHEAAETLEPSGQEDQPGPMGPSVLSFNSTTRRRNPSVDTKSKLGGVLVKELIDSKM